MNLWAIFCLLVLSSYTANLAAVMVGEKTFEQVSGIHDEKVRPGANLQSLTKEELMSKKIICEGLSAHIS